MKKSNERLLAIFDKQSDSIMDKVDELQIMAEQIQPMLYLRKLCTELNKQKESNIILQKIDAEYHFSDFADGNCPVCFIKEMTIEAATEFINDLNDSINSKMEKEYPDDEITDSDFFDED